MIDVKPTLQTLVKRAEIEFFPWLIKWNIESLVIEDDEQLKNSNDMLGIGKFLEKAVEEHRVEEKAPILAEGKRVDDEHNVIKNRIHLGVAKLDNAVITYHRKKKAEADALLKLQEEEEARKRKEAEAKQFQEMQDNVKRAEECAQTGEVFEATPITPLPGPEQLITKPVTNTVRGNMSSTSIRETYEYTITDESLVPKELCSPDIKKIKAFHQAQVALKKPVSIPGVLITTKSFTTTRVG